MSIPLTCSLTCPAHAQSASTQCTQLAQTQMLGRTYTSAHSVCTLMDLSDQITQAPRKHKKQIIVKSTLTGASTNWMIWTLKYQSMKHCPDCKV